MASHSPRYNAAKNTIHNLLLLHVSSILLYLKKTMEEKNTTEQIVIIGGGPAGLSAAIYASRANLSPLVIAGSPPGGQLTLTTDVENYPGYEAIMGPELIIKMRAHAAKFGTRFIDDNVTAVNFSNTPHTISLSDGTQKKAKAVIIAVGASALWLGLSSEQKLRGRGVSACATSDGFNFRDKTVAVEGGGDTEKEEANFLTKFASKVYLIHRQSTGFFWQSATGPIQRF